MRPGFLNISAKELACWWERHELDYEYANHGTTTAGYATLRVLEEFRISRIEHDWRTKIQSSPVAKPHAEWVARENRYFGRMGAAFTIIYDYLNSLSTEKEDRRYRCA